MNTTTFESRASALVPQGTNRKIHYIFLIDVSGSTAQRAYATLSRQADRMIRELGDVEYSIIMFADGTREVTHIPNLYTHACGLSGLSGYGTWTTEAMSAAVSVILSQETDCKIILYTDGTVEGVSAQSKANALRALLSVEIRTTIEIWVAPCDDKWDREMQRVMQVPECCSILQQPGLDWLKLMVDIANKTDTATLLAMVESANYVLSDKIHVKNFKGEMPYLFGTTSSKILERWTVEEINAVLNGACLDLEDISGERNKISMIVDIKKLLVHCRDDETRKHVARVLFKEMMELKVESVRCINRICGKPDTREKSKQEQLLAFVKKTNTVAERKQQINTNLRELEEQAICDDDEIYYLVINPMELYEIRSMRASSIDQNRFTVNLQAGQIVDIQERTSFIIVGTSTCTGTRSQEEMNKIRLLWRMQMDKVMKQQLRMTFGVQNEVAVGKYSVTEDLVWMPLMILIKRVHTSSDETLWILAETMLAMMHKDNKEGDLIVHGIAKRILMDEESIEESSLQWIKAICSDVDLTQALCVLVKEGPRNFVGILKKQVPVAQNQIAEWKDVEKRCMLCQCEIETIQYYELWLENQCIAGCPMCLDCCPHLVELSEQAGGYKHPIDRSIKFDSEKHMMLANFPTEYEPPLEILSKFKEFKLYSELMLSVPGSYRDRVDVVLKNIANAYQAQAALNLAAESRATAKAETNAVASETNNILNPRKTSRCDKCLEEFRSMNKLFAHLRSTKCGLLENKPNVYILPYISARELNKAHKIRVRERKKTRTE